MSVLFLPLPYALPIYRDRLIGQSYNGLSSSEANSNHKQLLGEIKKLGENKISVSVYGQDILPHAQAAYDALSGPVNDYHHAKAKWEARYRRIKQRQDDRKKRKEEREKEIAAKREADIFEAAVKLYIEQHSFFWRKPSREKAEEAVRKNNRESRGIAWQSFNPYMFDYLVHTEELVRMRSKTHPNKPPGIDDLPAIEEVRRAASLMPTAMLTIPVDTVNKIQRWAT